MLWLTASYCCCFFFFCNTSTVTRAVVGWRNRDGKFRIARRTLSNVYWIQYHNEGEHRNKEGKASVRGEGAGRLGKRFIKVTADVLSHKIWNSYLIILIILVVVVVVVQARREGVVFYGGTIVRPSSAPAGVVVRCYFDWRLWTVSLGSFVPRYEDYDDKRREQTTLVRVQTMPAGRFSTGVLHFHDTVYTTHCMISPNTNLPSKDSLWVGVHMIEYAFFLVTSSIRNRAFVRFRIAGYFSLQLSVLRSPGA